MNIVYLLENADLMQKSIEELKAKITAELLVMGNLCTCMENIRVHTKDGKTLMARMMDCNRAVSARIGELMVLLETAGVIEKQEHHDWLIHTARNLNMRRYAITEHFKAYRRHLTKDRVHFPA